jgi:Flp pilus assembly pilin Flp
MGKLRQLWQDDQGAVLATEYLFLVTILILGLVVGLSNLRTAINAELTELGNAILALSQGFAVNGTSGPGGSVPGSQAIDTPTTLPGSNSVPPSMPSFIDVPIS